MAKEIAGTVLECVKGNIAAQEDIEAVVNAANAQLKPGGGVAGAIHGAAGPGLEEECRPLAPIKPGEAVLTGAHNLPNRYVIHCLGPVYGKDKPEDKLLENCYRRALEIAEKNDIDSVAFPAISAGAFGYPLKEAAEIALKTAIEMAEKVQKVKLIRFVLFGDKDYTVFHETLAQLAG